jgi:hypothetical protein
VVSRICKPFPALCVSAVDGDETVCEAVWMYTAQNSYYTVRLPTKFTLLEFVTGNRFTDEA